MDAPRLNSFLLARGLLDRALLSVDGTAPGDMAAIVLSDLAVETGAKAAAAAHQPKGFPGTGYILSKEQRTQERARRRGRDPSFASVLDELLASARELAEPGSLADPPRAFGEVRKLHDQRNRVQHEAEIPAPGAPERARSRAGEFLTWVTETFFGVAFEEISRASLVRSETVRGLIEKAERQFLDGDVHEAAETIAIALDFGRREFRSGQPFRRSPTPMDISSAVNEVRRGGGELPGFGYRSLERLLKNMAQTIEFLADRMEGLSLGARAPEYDWFRRHFPKVLQLMSGTTTPRVYTLPVRQEMSGETYERGRDFVIDMVLQWERFAGPDQAARDDDSVDPSTPEAT